MANRPIFVLESSSVFAVTLTIASALRQEAGKELETVFGGMNASFVPLLEPPADDGGSGDYEPLTSARTGHRPMPWEGLGSNAGAMVSG